MPNHIEYSQEQELIDVCQKCLNGDLALSPIVQSNVIIEPIFRIRVDDDGESVPPNGSVIQLKKVPGEMQAVIPSKPHYILIVDYHFWENASEKARLAEMHSFLARIEVTKKDDGIKLKLKPWDIQAMASTVKSYGLYNDALAGFVEASGMQRLLLMAEGAVKNARPEPVETPAPARKAKPVRAAVTEEGDEEDTGRRGKNEDNEDEDSDPPRVIARPYSRTAAKSSRPEPE